MVHAVIDSREQKTWCNIVFWDWGINSPHQKTASNLLVGSFGIWGNLVFQETEFRNLHQVFSDWKLLVCTLQWCSNNLMFQSSIDDWVDHLIQMVDICDLHLTTHELIKNLRWYSRRTKKNFSSWVQLKLTCGTGRDRRVQ